MIAEAELYERDFYGWVQNQVAFLRAGKFNELDVDNLIEEVESMGKSERRELRSRIEVLLMHLLKWLYQPELRGASWQATIIEQRKRISEHLSENLSLKNVLPEAYEVTYGYAVLKAFKETGIGISDFPSQCPWSFEQIMNHDFWPEPEESETP